MDVTPLIPADRQVIDAYGPGIFRVSGTLYEGPVLVFPDRTQGWQAGSFAELSVESFSVIRGAQPAVEILLLGSGPKMGLLPSKLRRELREAGIVVDVMETGAACRTYNVLLSEERRVAAALLPV
ncbi:Mth938-like domain-containing protein [Skermanella sp. TT6]|uniref:Mth938-like domain-containing protein n=1 Tax=Skermanella cutis TaxID=2775420 RepID=A0ABX7BB34_9PROT|nr:Mth938-like domain-containing protein [Skermanella sp. TT6]QQP91586.1 Mth938-like domain-containing protein [Skermanella sp. TT6]